MIDPIETFKMPPELHQLLSRDANREVLDTILDVDRSLFERDPETEAGRGEGRHLWKLFDSIASKLTGKPNFLKLVEEIIPEVINVIRIELHWYPYSFDGDLRLYYLKAPIRKWRLRALAVPQASTKEHSGKITRKTRSATTRESGPKPAKAEEAPHRVAKRLRATIESPNAARRMEAYIDSTSIGQTEFANNVGVTDRTLRSFRQTGQVRRDIFKNIAQAMGITTEELLKSK